MFRFITIGLCLKKHVSESIFIHIMNMKAIFSFCSFPKKDGRMDIARSTQPVALIKNLYMYI